MSIKTTVRRAVTTALATALLAPALTLLGGTAFADTRTDIRDLARNNIGKQTCSTNSLGGQGFIDSCRMAHPWCADFARWVWGKAGLNTDRLTPAAGSFYLYGQNKGTLHNDAGYVPQVGDAVVLNYQGNGYADHVSIVDSVTATAMTTINGNYGGSGPTTSSVQYATGGNRVGQYIAGQRISAFVSPVGVGNPVPTTTPRIGILTTTGAVLGKEGALNTGWTTVHGGGIAKAKFDGDMVGVLDAGGTLHVKQGDMHQEWFPQMGGVKDFALESASGRIGVLRTDGTVAVKEGGLQGSWVEQTNGVAELTLSGNWIGVVYTNGVASIKQGNLYDSWADQLAGVKNLAIDATSGRIGVLRTDGTVTAKDGVYGTNWTEQTNGVVDLEISGDWIGVVFANGIASVKAGGLQDGWANQLGGVQDMEIDAATGRLGFLRPDGTLAAKAGGVHGTEWHEMADTVVDFDVTGY
ncbi:CHAP domain-containing protein [Saccharothrix yanglingensis]|uniref:Peptidase C51 domain-containing protein n=1 Tax=Saccharothrix yanglingensis TaxID=659496 RepID=A0ABU0X798_9PSEU|nr:CHAP domain-containing protein [Saccharothrix yanglingensis]MDQ2587492.1 hypothetical protein [Saccharothrix yanglingensis]